MGFRVEGVTEASLTSDVFVEKDGVQGRAWSAEGRGGGGGGGSQRAYRARKCTY